MTGDVYVCISDDVHLGLCITEDIFMFVCLKTCKTEDIYFYLYG